MPEGKREIRTSIYLCWGLHPITLHIFSCFVLITLFPFVSIYGQQSFDGLLSESAISLTKQKVQYDPSYFTITYPNGDIPADKGVCTDVVIRAYRLAGIDLQKEVHEDMLLHFDDYPSLWGLHAPDKNIDHRRVPNLMTFFSKFGELKTVSLNPEDYKTGDIVCWDLGSGITHIGIVTDSVSPVSHHRMVVHNIGNGQVLEDCLFDFRIIGHYAYQK